MKRTRPYAVWMPVMQTFLKDEYREKILADFRACRAHSLMIWAGMGCDRPKERFEKLKDLTAWFKKNGVAEVGAWTNDFWDFYRSAGDSVVHMVSVDGKETPFACPLDGGFRKYYGEYLKELAACGVDAILLDDDYRFTYMLDHAENFACTCSLHLSRIGELLGREVSAEELRRSLLTGGENPVRSAWLKVNKEGMEGFARDCRRALDEAGCGNVRLGACSCPQNWDMDGTDPVTLAKILAGKTRPMFRYSGAAYWAANHSFGGFYLQDVIELNRMEAAWFSSDDVDNLFEEDSYPRPRTKVPACYIECMDTALLADGQGGGGFKYLFDYTAHPDYERGYITRHVKNIPFCDDLEKTFAKKDSVGVRVWESQRKFEKMVIPKNMEGKTAVQHCCFSFASRMLAQAGIPTTYTGEGTVGICFGENARELPLSALSHGMILDARAAEILTDRGVDVGIRRFTGGTLAASLEEFPGTGLIFDQYKPLSLRRAELREGAEILSVGFHEKGSNVFSEKLPMTVRYENGKGERFLVYLWDDTYAEARGPHRNYLRGTQVRDETAWLTKGAHTLPASACGNPDFYLMAKEDATGFAVGAWNLSADDADGAVITLEKSYRSIRFLRGSGTLQGDRVTIDAFPGFTAVAFELTE